MQFRGGTPFNDYLFSRVLAGPDPAVNDDVSGYFSRPESGLDPRLIDPETGKVRPDIRQGVLELLYSFWRKRYSHPERWSTVWIAGSALAHQFDRLDPDLDVLIGVDHTKFFEDNPDFQNLPEDQVDARFDGEFDEGLEPTTKSWHGFEVTFYVNPGGADIRAIHPYAAFNLTTDEWTVTPIEVPEDWDPRNYFPSEWWQSLDTEVERAKGVLTTYHQLADSVRKLPQGAPEQLSRLAQLRRVVEQGGALFSDIHSGRKKAFQDNGLGYFDYYNLRWQVHKQAGTVKALHDLAVINTESRKSAQKALYGEEIVGAHDSTLIAALAPTKRTSVDWYRRKISGA